jgi:hypothetical protein
MTMEPDSQPNHTHTCFVCGKNAGFGFTTRTEDVWTCLAHRIEGDKRLVAPSMARPDRANPGRGTSGPWSTS